MLDLLLGWAVIFFPTALAVAFIFVPARSENEHAHMNMKWRVGLVIFGVLFSLLSWLQQSRAIKTASDDRESAIRETSTRVASETSDRVTKAVTAQYQETISGLNRQIGGLQTELSALHKTSRETTSALVKLNATTEESVKSIPVPRRIPKELRAKLIAALSVHRGTVTISAVGGDAESLQFANDWYEVLSEAGWTITSQVNIRIAPNPPNGVVMTIKGEPVGPGVPFDIPPQHPASSLGRALLSVTRYVTGQRQTDISDEVTLLDVGVVPRHDD